MLSTASRSVCLSWDQCASREQVLHFGFHRLVLAVAFDLLTSSILHAVLLHAKVLRFDQRLLALLHKALHEAVLVAGVQLDRRLLLL